MDISCCICNRPARQLHSKHRGYQEPQTYAIYHCRHCDTAFASPLELDKEIYNVIYKNVGKIAGYDRYLIYADEVLKRKNPLSYLASAEEMYWAVENALATTCTHRSKILEVGCGFGYLTYALSKAGYDIHGIDISQVAIDQATQRYGKLYSCVSIEEYAKQHPQEYDAVIFTEVIEHIPNVKEFLQAANALVKQGGVLVMTTPNKTPYPRDVLWETEPPPVHLWWFSEQSLNHLAGQLGHQVAFVDFTEFNIKEVQRLGYFMKPHTSTAHYMPTRLPRLGKGGEILNNAVAEYLQNDARLQKRTGIKKAIERLLHKLHLLPLALAIKNPKKEWQRMQHKSAWIHFLRRHPQRRSTLCAIFHKPKV